MCFGHWPQRDHCTAVYRPSHFCRTITQLSDAIQHTLIQSNALGLRYELTVACNDQMAELQLAVDDDISMKVRCTKTT